MVFKASLRVQKLELLGFGVIFAGAATSFLQVFTPATWVPPLTAGLGALIALSEGWQRIARYGETWVAYRTASERMKRERRLYANIRKSPHSVVFWRRRSRWHRAAFGKYRIYASPAPRRRHRLALDGIIHVAQKCSHAFTHIVDR